MTLPRCSVDGCPFPAQIRGDPPLLCLTHKDEADADKRLATEIHRNRQRWAEHLEERGAFKPIRQPREVTR